MNIAGYKIAWESQLPNLSERIKANFYANVNHVATGATETAIHEAALVTKGYAGVSFVVDPGPGAVGKIIATLGPVTAIAALMGVTTVLAGAQLKLWQLRQERKRPSR